MLSRTIGKRLAQMIVVLLGVSFLASILVDLLPGDIARTILGIEATQGQVQQLRAQLGLNRPILTRYIDWLGNFVRGNWGQSLINKESVGTLIAQRAPVTIELLVVAVVIAVASCVVLVTYATIRAGGFLDRSLAAISAASLSTPGFVVAIVLILVFAVHARILPAVGFSPLSAGLGANLRTILLPSIALAISLFGTYVRVLRADMAEQMASEHVTVAWAKGLSRNRVVVSHVLRNSLLGLVTVVGVNLGILIGGAVAIESIFAVPGIGQLLVTSVTQKDTPVVQAVVVMTAVAVVVINLITDLLYAVLDPRIRLGGARD
jgi:peptide/nickel transport system permease protein